MFDSIDQGERMRTVVYQSFRTVDVPAWVQQCLDSVQAWASMWGFDYRFIDDRMFDYVPDWYREKTKNEVRLVSDLARLLIARELLAEGFDRTIWVDADVVVFAPERLSIPVQEEYAFCREVWLVGGTLLRSKSFVNRVIGRERRFHAHPPGVNNAIMVFVKGNSFLDFYIHACETMVGKKTGDIDTGEVGAGFLTHLYHRMPFPLINNVGLFSPLITVDLGTGGTSYARVYMGKFGNPIYAANLGTSERNQTYYGVVMTDELYSTVVSQLLSSKGDIVNNLL